MEPTAQQKLNTVQIANHKSRSLVNGFFIVKNKAKISLFQCDFSMIVTLLNTLFYRLHTWHRERRLEYGAN